MLLWRCMKQQKKISWNKGHNKFTHPSVLKISKTLATKPISNFHFWQLQNKKEYKKFKKDAVLAELIGVILGDGNIEAFPRTERLVISCNSEDKELINRYGEFIAKIFKKYPTFIKSKISNCVRISIYEKFISKRLDIPTGNKGKSKFKIPNWILKNKRFLIAYLRGLYEAEGSFCTHKPTGTYKIIFYNKNKSLLNNVYKGLKILGFHPHKSQYRIQISKKKEVFQFNALTKFRQY